MKRVLFSILIFHVTISCIINIDDDDGASGDCAQGRGNYRLEVIEVPSFGQLSVSVPARVYLRQEDRSVVRIEAQESVLPRIKTKVEHGQLAITADQCLRDVDRINIYVSSPRFSQIDNNGVALTMAVGALDLQASGSSHIGLAGTAIEQSVAIFGVASYRANGLASEACRISINGAGTAEVNCTASLDAAINGIGTIRYKGNPALVHSDISGAGKLANAG